MKIKELLDYGKQELNKKNIEEVSLKVRILLSNLLNVSKEYLIIHDSAEVQDCIENEFKSQIERLLMGEPVQYITNHQEFFGREFYVDKNVLIPQPDTEVLVQESLNVLKKIKNPKILDLCTGSGIIAVSLKKNLENAEIVASDISKKALNIAKTNADKNNAEIKFIESNLFENISEKFDAVVSNPPYIETKVIEKLSLEVKHEPIIALDGGKDGLDFYKDIAKKSKEFLNDNGYLILEIGYDQKEKVTKLLENEGFKNIKCIKDFDSNDRVIISNR